MNEGINNVIELIKEGIERGNGSNYFIRLNENDIDCVAGNRISNKIKVDDISILDLIRETCNGIINTLPTKEVSCLITIDSFAGEVATPTSSPIQVFFELEDGNVLLLSFTSSVDKNLEWLNNYVHYYASHNKGDIDYNEFDELNEYIEYLDNGGYKQEGQKK